jgi:hypothetical protein
MSAEILKPLSNISYAFFNPGKANPAFVEDNAWHLKLLITPPLGYFCNLSR